MKIYFVRHGETDWNKSRRVQGRTDIPLNEFGRRLAGKTAEGLSNIPFDVCFTSPLSRAEETARIIIGNRNIPVIKENRIIEMAFGDYEGKCCSKKGWELPEEFHLFFNAPEHYRAPAGGEDFLDVRNRMGEFFESLCENEKYKDSVLLVATHGAALSGMLNYIKKEPLSAYWGTGVHKNCAVTEVEVLEGSAFVVSENAVYYDDIAEPWEDE